MRRLNISVVKLFIYSISIASATNALALEKNVIINIPSPMSEFIKRQEPHLPVPSQSPHCQANEQYLNEKKSDYQRRLRDIKWNKANHTCDARFEISHIIASDIQTPFHQPFHHMSVDASLEATPIAKWAQMTETDKTYVVTFVPSPFSFETMGTAENLGQLYARRIWKISSGLGINKIGNIIINKNDDNANITDAIVQNLTSQNRKNIADSDYRVLANKLQVKPDADNAALAPFFAKLAATLKSYEQNKNIVKIFEVPSLAEENPTALILIALHKYFWDFQRIDFTKNSKIEKILKSVNNSTKTIRLVRELQTIIKNHPQALRPLSESVLEKIQTMFTVTQANNSNNAGANQLATLMSEVPGILMSDLECANITNILINVITSSGGSLREYTLEELLSKSMAALSPIIAEMAVDSINYLIASANVTITYQPLSSEESRFYSSAELSKLFFSGLELPNDSDFPAVFLQFNSIFARLKEFYLRAYDGILLFNKTKSDRTPSSVQQDDRTEQVISASNCPVQKYKFSSRFFDATEAEIEFKKVEQEAAISIPITRQPLQPQLTMDLAKQEIEKQLLAAANSLPRVMSSMPTGQLEQLLAVLSQQSLSVADILRNTSFNGNSHFYLQIVLSPTDVFDSKKVMTGSRFPVPVKKLLPENGDPLCDARNVVIVLDYLLDTNGDMKFKLQWGIQLPRQFFQPFSEFTEQPQGLIVKNSPGKPDQIHISGFQLLPPTGADRSHFALLTLSANGPLGLKNISANIKFGPQMSLLFDPQFTESKALNFTNKQNVFIETPKQADIFDGPLKNSDNSTLEILWSVGLSKKNKNVCAENETFGPLLNLSKAYPQPLQSTLNKIGLYNVLMHTGRARLDELELSLHIDPAKVDSENYSPTVTMNKFELQVFPYNLEAEYKPNNYQAFFIKPQGVPGDSRRVMLNLGHWLCFPLPHNKEIGIMSNVTETFNKKMPNIWMQTRKLLNQIKSLMGSSIQNPTSDVENIDTDTYPESQAGE